MQTLHDWVSYLGEIHELDLVGDIAQPLQELLSELHFAGLKAVLNGLSLKQVLLGSLVVTRGL